MSGFGRPGKRKAASRSPAALACSGRSRSRLRALTRLRPELICGAGAIAGDRPALSSGRRASACRAARPRHNAVTGSSPSSREARSTSPAWRGIRIVAVARDLHSLAAFRACGSDILESEDGRQPRDTRFVPDPAISAVSGCRRSPSQAAKSPDCRTGSSRVSTRDPHRTVEGSAQGRRRSSMRRRRPDHQGPTPVVFGAGDRMADGRTRGK